jgi:hypothetical protein
MNKEQEYTDREKCFRDLKLQKIVKPVKSGSKAKSSTSTTTNTATKTATTTTTTTRQRKIPIANFQKVSLIFSMAFVFAFQG